MEKTEKRSLKWKENISTDYKFAAVVDVTDIAKSIFGHVDKAMVMIYESDERFEIPKEYKIPTQQITNNLWLKIDGHEVIISSSEWINIKNK